MIFYDISHLQYQVQNEKCWQLKGVEYTKVFKSICSKKRINILGAFNRKLNRFTIFMSKSTCNKELVCDFLEVLKADYRWRREELNIVLDGAKYNRSYDTQDRAEDLGIKLNYLPKSSPNLNIIERLWKFLKKHIVRNKYYESFIDFEEAVADFFKNIHQYDKELASLLTMKFEIISAN